MDLKPGSRWKSAVCSGEFVIVRPPKTGGVLACGGAPVIQYGAETPAGATVSPDHAGGVILGKRYADADSGMVVLASKGGQGGLSLDDRPLVQEDAKKLPASD
ncbi:hypothetical protein [Phenylobacterium sp.]|jgi:hypothetical protein|uniref:hypothetical protein n=1 Tax=Phenylobacterium sp. TaxID=1871053 RepID=UPI002F3E250F